MDDLVRRELRRLRAEAERHDGKVVADALRRAVDDNVSLAAAARRLDRALMPIDEALGAILHAVVLACGPQLVVELGTSGGASSLYIAAALRQQGFGRLITTEIVPEKARRASAVLARARVSDLVELRIGDARQTLNGLVEPAGVVFLDGWQDGYADVLRVLEPVLITGSVVIADDASEPLATQYLRIVRDPSGPYRSSRLAVDHPVELSIRRAAS